jgi:hypothetical protein
MIVALVEAQLNKETFCRPLGVKLNSANWVQTQCAACWSIADLYDPMTEKPKDDNPPLYPDGLLEM